MAYEILKSFPFSTDGIKHTLASQGETRSDIPSDLLEGLEAEGYIQQAGPKNKSLSTVPETGGVVGGDGNEGSNTEPGPGATDGDDSTDNTSTTTDGDLDKLTVNDLTELAAREGIEITAGGRKADIVSAITAARQAKATG